MFFNKKEDTIESLVKKCSKEYHSFLSYQTKAHFEQYYLFKQELKTQFLFLQEVISVSKNDELTLDLLKHFKQQLSFINAYPFSAPKDKMDKFMNENFPYVEKVEQITKNYTRKPNP